MTCVGCGTTLGKGNISGQCRKCAMREAGRRRRQENDEFATLVQACPMASEEAISRLLVFLIEGKRRRDLIFARNLGTAITVRLTADVNLDCLERLWHGAQVRAKLPPMTIESADGYVR